MSALSRLVDAHSALLAHTVIREDVIVVEGDALVT